MKLQMGDKFKEKPTCISVWSQATTSLQNSFRALELCWMDEHHSSTKYSLICIFHLYLITHLIEIKISRAAETWVQQIERKTNKARQEDIFLRNTVSQDNRKVIKDISDFNHRVIKKSASLKERRAKSIYKKLIISHKVAKSYGFEYMFIWFLVQLIISRSTTMYWWTANTITYFASQTLLSFKSLESLRNFLVFQGNSHFLMEMINWSNLQSRHC